MSAPRALTHGRRDVTPRAPVQADSRWRLYAEQMAALYAQVAAGELAPETGGRARER